MEFSKQENELFITGRSQNIKGEAKVEVRFDMAAGRRLLEDTFAIAAQREVCVGTRMDLMRVYPRNNVTELVVCRLPFGPHWPVTPRAFICDATSDMEGIDAAGSESLWHALRNRGILGEDATPAPTFLLEAPQPLEIEGWSVAQCAFVRARAFSHMRAMAYAELSPKGSLKIAADRFVLTQISGGLLKGMGRSPVTHTGERLRLMPEPRFCFDKGARDASHQSVAQLDLVGFYTEKDAALDFLADSIDGEAEGFEGVIFDV